MFFVLTTIEFSLKRRARKPAQKRLFPFVKFFWQAKREKQRGGKRSIMRTSLYYAQNIFHGFAQAEENRGITLCEAPRFCGRENVSGYVTNINNFNVFSDCKLLFIIFCLCHWTFDMFSALTCASLVLR